MLVHSIKKLVRISTPFFVETEDPNIFLVVVTPYYVKEREDVQLERVTLCKVQIVDDIENSDTSFSVWNEKTLTSDTVYVKIIA